MFYLHSNLKWPFGTVGGPYLKSPKISLEHKTKCQECWLVRWTSKLTQNLIVKVFSFLKLKLVKGRYPKNFSSLKCKMLGNNVFAIQFSDN